MPAPNNFLPFNPAGQNMETDAQYGADALRQAGFANPSILPSALTNKILYQLSTFVAAFAQALSVKGYPMTDANLQNLAGALANVMTLGDMAGYAPLAGPHFSGAPTAPTPASGDNSGAVATTGFVKNQNYAPLQSPALAGAPTAPTPNAGDNSPALATTAFVKGQNYQPALGFAPVQQGGGVNQWANKLFLGWDGANLRYQVDGTDYGALARLSHFYGQYGASAGAIRMLTPQGAWLMQWGAGGTDPGYAAGSIRRLTFPNAFAVAPFVSFTPSNGGVSTDWPGVNVMGADTGGFSFTLSSGGQHGFFWMALGS